METQLKVVRLARQIRALGPENRAFRTAYERELVELYQSGEAASSDVIAVFAPFAHSFAVRLKRGEEPFEDLKQVAMVGLMKALAGFNPAVGQSFTAYAAPTILGELRRHYRNTGWAVHVPRDAQELAQRVYKAREEFEKAGVDPSDAELSQRLGVTIQRIGEGRLAARALRTTSLDRPADFDAGVRTTIADAHGAVDPGFAAAERRATIAALTGGLEDRDRCILALRFAREMSQAAIGRRVGISQMQVSRGLAQVLAKLGEMADRGTASMR